MPANNPAAYSDPNSPFYDPAKAAQLAQMQAQGVMDPGELDPALMEQVLKLGTLGGRSQRLADKLRMAQQQQQAAMPEGRSAGGVYQAAHPLEVIGSLAQRGMGAYREGQLEKQFGPLEEEQLAGRRGYLEEMMRKLRGGPRRNAQISSSPGTPSSDEMGPGGMGPQY